MHVNYCLNALNKKPAKGQGGLKGEARKVVFGRPGGRAGGRSAPDDDDCDNDDVDECR